MQRTLSLETTSPPSFSIHGPTRQARLTFHGRQIGGPGDGRPVLAVLYGFSAFDVFLASEQAFSDHVAEGGTLETFRARFDLKGRWRRRDGGQGAWEFAADSARRLPLLDPAHAA